MNPKPCPSHSIDQNLDRSAGRTKSTTNYGRSRYPMLHTREAISMSDSSECVNHVVDNKNQFEGHSRLLNWSSDCVWDNLDHQLDKYASDLGHISDHPIRLPNTSSIRFPHSFYKTVCDQYASLRLEPISDSVCLSLSDITFDNWSYSDAQLLAYLRFMFIDLHLVRHCSIPLDTLDAWLLAVYRRYNNVPFHNFKHAFTVAQMMYCIIKSNELETWLPALDLLILMFSALSHDLDHPGFSNSYQINAQSWLALRYNDQSPLENHHCAVAFDLLLAGRTTNLTVHFNQSDFAWFRKAVIRCILATDMTMHAQCRTKFQNLLDHFRSHVNPAGTDDGQWKQLPSSSSSSLLNDVFPERSEQRLLLFVTLVKLCDISNEFRPLSVSQIWLEQLMVEFSLQVQAEKHIGLPVAPFMDEECISRAENQCLFISNTLLPFLKDVETILPNLQKCTLALTGRLDYYTQMFASEQRRQQRLQNQSPTQPDSDVMHAHNKKISSSELLESVLNRVKIPTDESSRKALLSCSVSTSNPINMTAVAGKLSYSHHPNRNHRSDSASLSSVRIDDTHLSHNYYSPRASPTLLSSSPLQQQNPGLHYPTHIPFALHYEPEILSDVAVPSRKSSTGSMVAASS